MHPAFAAPVSETGMRPRAFLMGLLLYLQQSIFWLPHPIGQIMPMVAAAVLSIGTGVDVRIDLNR
jgi:hypothetical protein